MKLIVLDTGVLSLLTTPKASMASTQCATWFAQQLRAGSRFAIPEIADYEIRRELIRANKSASIARLDQFAAAVPYHALTTSIMREAAELWALARNT